MINTVLAKHYAPIVLAQAGRLLSCLDREPQSVSYGSFDRDHWSWKFRDFPLGMLQASLYSLAMLWAIPLPDSKFYRNSRLLEWIQAGLTETVRRQHGNGAFDAFAPNDQDPGATLAISYYLTEVLRLLEPVLSSANKEAAIGAVSKACKFTFCREETHAFISNHQALFAVSYHNAGELLGDLQYCQRAEGIIDRIIQAQSPDGWYREYGGPDPGYESLSVHYLTGYWERTGSARLLRSLRRSIEFYACCIHPDGSVGGAYGSRHTSLYCPGGFERLGTAIPLAAAVARFMREHLSSNNVLTPINSDIHNLPSLLNSYLHACVSPAPEVAAVVQEESLPCETLLGMRSFEESALRVVGARGYYAVVNLSKGGVCRIFDKATATVAYEDSGYLIKSGKHFWTSQRIGQGSAIDCGHRHQIGCETVLTEVRYHLPTPANVLLLRLLNLTLFHSPDLGAWIRRLVVRRLIEHKRLGPFSLRRRMTFTDSEIAFKDELSRVGDAPVDAIELTRAFIAIHMGSARYFHSSDLECTTRVNTDGLAAALDRHGAAEHRWTVRFPARLSSQLANVSFEVAQS